MTLIPIKEDAKKLGLDSVMTFGRFKGDTVKQVADKRAGYLLWAIKNVPWFELDAEARKYGQQRLNIEDQNKIERMNAWAWGCFSKARYGYESDHDWQR